MANQPSPNVRRAPSATGKFSMYLMYLTSSLKHPLFSISLTSWMFIVLKLFIDCFIGMFGMWMFHGGIVYVIVMLHFRQVGEVMIC